jgi:ribosome-associated protein
MSLTPEQIASVVANAMDDKKAINILTLGLQGISLIADYFVICHGNSEVQVQAITDEVRKKLGESGVKVKGIEGLSTARWVLIDMGDVVAHIFHRDDREFYNIERLWADAKAVERV